MIDWLKKLDKTKELKKQKSGWIWLNGSEYYHRLTYEINHIPVLCDPNTKALTVNVEYGYFDITEPSSPDNLEEWYDLSGKNARSAAFYPRSEKSP